MSSQLICYIVFMFLAIISPSFEASLGSWQLVVNNAGVASMHAALLPKTNKIIMFDRTDFGPSQIKLPNGKCRVDPNDQALTTDCWAHSIELDVSTWKVRPLEILTDTWCSSGAFTANGTLVQTGGYNDGANGVRYFDPLCKKCDWVETGSMVNGRWYASDQILPDNRVIVVGGLYQFNYEFVPRQPGESDHALPFLSQTTDSALNNLYPFLHLSTDGNLFIFANSDSILLDYKQNKVLRTFPTLPGGSRNYPSSGSSVMLPLSASDGFTKVEIMVCGGAPAGSYAQSGNGIYLTALDSCARMVITDTNPSWTIETMPIPRVMGDMLILPTGDILIINGAQKGTSGWGQASTPALSPLLYNPTSRIFTTLTPSTIPRMYHSTPTIVPDGRVVVAGSNTHFNYVFTGDFPTELRVEAFSPPYLDVSNNAQRPTILSLSLTHSYNKKFTVNFSVTTLSTIQVNVYAPPFTTHSYSQGQRMLSLSTTTATKISTGYQIVVSSPPNSIVAPSGYYLLSVVNGEVPSTAKWVKFV